MPATPPAPETTTAPAAEPADKLLPCPFCGTLPEIDHHEEYPDEGIDQFWIAQCVGRDCTGSPHSCADTRAEAIDAWNTRHDGSGVLIAIIELIGQGLIEINPETNRIRATQAGRDAAS